MGTDARAKWPWIALFTALILVTAARPTAAAAFEVGAFGGGGLALAYGSFLDSKSEAVAELGAASLTDVGSSDVILFPGWTGGIYGQMDVLSWLTLETEITFESQGAARLARTSSGSRFDQYGVYFASVTIPFKGRAGFPLGPGRFSGSLGPFLGIVVSDITVVDRYASTSTEAVITPDFAHRFYFGLAGGVGYSIPLGPGIAGIEVRSDWSILGMTVSQGQPDGDLNPIGLYLVLSYGIRLGKETAVR